MNEYEKEEDFFLLKQTLLKLMSASDMGFNGY